MRRFVYEFRAVFLGLMIAQILSTLSVYSSNAELFRSARALMEAGYLTVPNSNTVNTLTTFRAAFFGGMFFTFSIGAGLSLLSFALGYVWDRVFERNEYVLIPFLILWLWCIISVNDKGISRIPTAYFLFIPPAVFAVTILRNPEEFSEDTRLKTAVHLIAFTSLMIIGSAQMNTDIFLKIRDNLLLSNPVGMRLNDFYYRYTLYAAQVFKSRNQKLIKTCRLSLADDPLQQQMEKHLLNNDYLVLDTRDPDIPADLEIIKIQDLLEFKIRVWTILEVSPREFLQYPQDVLKQFSRNSDKHAFFRSATFYFLAASLLLLFYFLSYGLCCQICILFMKAAVFIHPAFSAPHKERVAVSAGILCIILGSAVFLYMGMENRAYRDSGDLAGMLVSENGHQRMAALRYITKNNLDISRFSGYSAILNSPSVPDRYWLAKALAHSRSPETYRELMRLLEDSDFNVVYSAMYALGERGDRQAVPELLRQIARSDNWYVQWYAYKALRKLGWTQAKSK